MGRLMKTFRYFGYGSNMLTERLRAPNRCPGATPLGVVRVDGFRLAFSKYSNRDRSGKATLVPDTNARVYGVVFDIPLSELDALNREEGLNRGYALHENFALTLADGSASTARVYLAGKTTSGFGRLTGTWRLCSQVRFSTSCRRICQNHCRDRL